MFANAESAAFIATQQMLQIPANMPGESAKVYVIEGRKTEAASSETELEPENPKETLQFCPSPSRSRRRSRLAGLSTLPAHPPHQQFSNAL
jgi:hypothetical protein